MDNQDQLQELFEKCLIKFDKYENPKLLITKICMSLVNSEEFSIKEKQKMLEEIYCNTNTQEISAEVKEYQVLIKSRRKETETMKAMISHISSSQDLLFHVINFHSAHKNAITELTANKQNFKKINVNKTNYEAVFGIYLEEDIWRAKYIKYEEGFLLLLDTGEIVPETIVGTDKFQLPLNVQKIPPLAQLCKLIGVIGAEEEHIIDLHMLIKEHLYNFVNLRIIKNVENILFVKFIQEQEEEEEEEKNQHHLKEAAEAAEEEEEALPLYALDNNLDAFEEMVNFGHTNATKAILGYEPQDDKRLCRFYNPKTGACFKFGNCKKDHQLRSTDAFTKDLLPTEFISNLNHPVVQFEDNQIIDIVITHIKNLNCFYAQIENIREVPKLQWTDNEIPTYNRFQMKEKRPQLLDMVLARFENNVWYRARIVDQYENFNYSVFYVDYGNCSVVNIRDLAVCFVNVRNEPECAHIIFLHELYSNTKSKIQYDLVKDELEKALLYKSCKVRVIDQDHDELHVEFVENQQIQLINKFVEKNMLKTNYD